MPTASVVRLRNATHQFWRESTGRRQNLRRTRRNTTCTARKAAAAAAADLLSPPDGTFPMLFPMHDEDVRAPRPQAPVAHTAQGLGLVVRCADRTFSRPNATSTSCRISGSATRRRIRTATTCARCRRSSARRAARSPRASSRRPRTGRATRRAPPQPTRSWLPARLASRAPPRLVVVRRRHRRPCARASWTASCGWITFRSADDRLPDRRRARQGD